MPERFPVDVDRERVTAVAYAASEPLALTLLFGHGTSGDQDAAVIVDLATRLASRGVLAVTYNFPFAEDGRRAPDRIEVLERCTRAAVVAAGQCRPKNHLFLGGRSLSAHVASRVAAASAEELHDAEGLVLVSYPLHPVGARDEAHAGHLRDINIPMLFVQGSLDAFGTPEEIRPYLHEAPAGTEVYAIEGGDHSLAASRGGVPSQREIDIAIADEIVGWMQRVVRARGKLRPTPPRRSIASRVRDQLRFLRRSASGRS